jgi:hypothetical protein
MEPKGSLPCAQVPATGPSPEPNESGPCCHFLCCKIYFNIIILSVPRSYVLTSNLFCSGFLTKILHEFLMLLKCATCATHLILDFITLTVFGEEYKFMSSL